MNIFPFRYRRKVIFRILSVILICQTLIRYRQKLEISFLSVISGASPRFWYRQKLKFSFLSVISGASPGFRYRQKLKFSFLSVHHLPVPLPDHKYTTLKKNTQNLYFSIRPVIASVSTLMSVVKSESVRLSFAWWH